MFRFQVEKQLWEGNDRHGEADTHDNTIQRHKRYFGIFLPIRSATSPVPCYEAWHLFKMPGRCATWDAEGPGSPESLTP